MVRINGNFHFPQDGASNSKYVKPEDSNSSLFGTKPLENTGKGYTVESSGQPDGAKGAAKSNGANAGVSMTEVDALNNLLPEHRTSEDGREYTFLIKDGALAIKIADPYDANNSFTIKVRPPEKLTADKVVEYAHFQNLTCNDNGDPITINKDIKDVKKGDDGNVTITFKNGLTFTFPLSDDPNIEKPTDWAVNYPEINPPQVEEGSNLDKFYDFIDAIGLADKKGADCLITSAKTTGLDWNNFNGTAGVQMKLAENQDLKNINENPKVTFSINDTSNVQTTITGRVSVDEAGIITITSDNGEIVKFTPVVTDGITEYIVSANGNELYKLGAAHFPEDNTTRVIIGHKNPDGTYTETDVLKDQVEEFNMSEIPCFGEAYQHLDVTQQRAANHQLKAEANASVSIKVFQSGGQEYKTEIEQNGKRYVLDRVIDSAGRVYPDNTVGMGRMGIYIPIDD